MILSVTFNKKKKMDSISLLYPWWNIRMVIKSIDSESLLINESDCIIQLLSATTYPESSNGYFDWIF